jgi:hypothetical protein
VPAASADGRDDIDRRSFRQSQAHEQPKRQRIADQPDRHRLLQDFGQLIGAVEGKIGDAPAVEGFADGRPGLDRMHEVDLRRRQELAHQPDLGDRTAVEMPDTTSPQRSEYGWIGVALYSVENVAREAAAKAPHRPDDGPRAQAEQRIRRAQIGDDHIDGRQGRIREWTQRDLAGLCHRTILQRQETTCRSGRRRRLGEMTDRGEASRRGSGAPKRQTMVRGLRIACRNISVPLTDMA